MLKVAFHEDYVHPLPKGHKFPMEKYELLPQQLLHEGTLDSDHFFEPELIQPELIHEVHLPKYTERLFNLKLSPREQRVTGFVHSQSLIRREIRIMEGTRRCAEWALENGAAMNIAGGTHHAYTDKGEGFCLLNDNAIAAKWLLNEGKATNILIIDLDVHQGNGTAEIFQDEDRVFTFSMHGKNNYPLKKEVSDLDVELEDGTRDSDYLDTLKKHLDTILARFTPDFLFFQSGVDVLETDKLGRLALSAEGCLARDKYVVGLSRELNVPIVCSMGGGYSPNIRHIIDAHANTFRTVQNILF